MFFIGTEMDRYTLFKLAEDIVNGYAPNIDEYRDLAAIEEQDVFAFFAGADMIRDHYFGHEIHLCCILWN